MNKTDFAELKSKLCEFDYNENDMCSQASKKYGTGPINGAYKDGYISSYESAHTKSAAIISELIEIIQSQSEKLNELNEFTSSVLEDMEHYFDNKCVPTLDEVNQCAIADSLLRVCIGQTTTRLQKLRDGNESGK